MKKLMWVVAAMMAAGMQGAVIPGTPFSDGAILQRDRIVPVWGMADVGEKVTVSFAGVTREVIAGADGAWRVNLPPMPACREGRVLKINTLEIKDVLVGEVWFVCGQSNTELPLVGGNPRFRDRQGMLVAQMTKKSQVRFVKASNYTCSMTPRKLAARPVAWQTFTPENLSKRDAFSAMGFYYALELASALDMPVGVVGAYWGGTRIEPWTPREGFEAVAGLEEEAVYVPGSGAGFDTNAMKKLCPHIYRTHLAEHQQPTVLWNAMVAPWAPYAMRGFIWYQGCSNAGEYRRYDKLMHALYRGWAKKFENPELKLNFVQLAPWGYENIALIQMSQAKFEREEPHAGMAVICDIGNLADIHPNEKELVAKRLAVHALKRDYGWTELEDCSPVLKCWTADGNKARLIFDHAKKMYIYNPDRSLKTGFELAGADGVWKPAKVVNTTKNADGNLAGQEIVLTADGVAEPKKVRYLFRRPWFGAVYNEVNLPLGAFEAE